MRHGAAHVFVEDVTAPGLAPEDAHHLARVLRLRDGETVTVADGRGGWRECAFVDGGLAPRGDVVRVPPPVSPVTVAFALAKGDKPELIVQKLTELGVNRIVPVAAARSVVRWDAAKAAHHGERLAAVARAAAMQSRQAFLPVLDPVVEFGVFAASEPGVALAHPGGDPLDATLRSIAVGPEGGWTEAEMASVGRHVELGPTTLRTETAAVAAGVLLTALRDGRIRAESHE